jgi:hypothetical protein
MAYTMKPLGCDPQHIGGMSEKLIVSHYQNNYRRCKAAQAACRAVGGARLQFGVELCYQRSQAGRVDRDQFDDPA